jgi:hypothetical protein
MACAVGIDSPVGQAPNDTKAALPIVRRSMQAAAARRARQTICPGKKNDGPPKRAIAGQLTLALCYPD